MTYRRPNSFVMITANRVLHCNADTPEEMHHWITLLQRCKGDARVDGQEFIIRGEAPNSAETFLASAMNCFLTRISLLPPGWLHKETKNSSKASLKLKKRWFLLTHNSLDCYRSSERGAVKLGTLVLSSLCAVVPPDERVFREAGESPPPRALLQLDTSSVLPPFDVSVSCPPRRQATGT